MVKNEDKEDGQKYQDIIKSYGVVLIIETLGQIVSTEIKFGIMGLLAY